MAMELFGIEVAHYAAISVVISFLMTGHRSVFPSQILAMKKSDMLNIKTGESIEDTEVSMHDEDINKIRDIRKRLQSKRKKRHEKPKSRL